MYHRPFALSLLVLMLTAAMLIGGSQLVMSAPSAAATRTKVVSGYSPITANNAAQLVEIASEKAIDDEWTWLPDGHRVLTTSGILDFDGKTFRSAETFPDDFFAPFSLLRGSVYRSIANNISANGTIVLGFFMFEPPTNPPTIYLWKALTPKKLTKIHPFSPGRQAGDVIAISSDASKVIALEQGATSHSAVRVWDVANDKLIRAFDDPDLGVGAASFSPDGSIVMLAFINHGSGVQDDEVRLYEVSTGRELLRTKSSTFDRLINAEISSDNRYFALLNGTDTNRFKLWDLTSGNAIDLRLSGSTPSTSITNFTFSPHADLLFVQLANFHQYYATAAVSVIDMSTQRPVALLNTKNIFTTGKMTVSPDGRWLTFDIFRNDHPSEDVMTSLWAVDNVGLGIAATQTSLPLTATADAATPTLTPTATLTPTPIAPTSATKLKVGDSAYIVTRSPFTPANLLDAPTPNANFKQSCAPSTVVTILALSQDSGNAASSSIYYEVDCAGQRGWLSEAYLTAFKQGDQVTVQTTTGEAAPMYKAADVNTKLDAVCEVGSTGKVQEITQSAKPDLDPHVYIRFTCADVTAYVADADLVKTDN